MKRSKYRRNKHFLSGMVDDFILIACAFGPIGAIACGIVGFFLFYFLVPLWLQSSIEAQQAKTISSYMSPLVGQVALIRLINPCKWGGIAILLGGILVAICKVLNLLTSKNHEVADINWLAKVIAYFLSKD